MSEGKRKKVMNELNFRHPRPTRSPLTKSDPNSVETRQDKLLLHREMEFIHCNAHSTLPVTSFILIAINCRRRVCSKAVSLFPVDSYARRNRTNLNAFYFLFNRHPLRIILHACGTRNVSNMISVDVAKYLNWKSAQLKQVQVKQLKDCRSAVNLDWKTNSLQLDCSARLNWSEA